MSPTVLRADGYRVMIYLNDHTPAHVHVSKGENEARVKLEPVEILHNFGFNLRELGAITAIIMSEQGNLLAQWDKIHLWR